MAGIFKAYDIRGVYPSQLDEAAAEGIGKAFAAFLRPRSVVVGRDMRPHSRPLFEAFARGAASMGADVVDIGLCSTPMCYYACGSLKADASAMITASHNPGEWNGFKLCRSDAVPLSGATGIAEIERIFNAKDFGAPYAAPGSITERDIGPDYARHVRASAKLSGRRLKVVMDFANAMGSREVAGIRDMFDVTPLYEELDGTFPNHEANPLHLETLDDACRKVVECGADFGAAFDGDADRCGFIDDKGRIIPMDLFTALIAQDILADGPATILYDLRSSWAVRECIEENGGKAVMCRVGHAFIKNEMRRHGAVFAGELSGHYYFKENFTAESQAMAVLRLANLVCKSGRPVSELVAPLRRYHASGEINSVVKDPKAILEALRRRYSDGRAFELDGLSVEYPDWWFNVRSSNTEPLLRLNMEARTQAMMEARRDELLGIIRGG